MKWERTWESFKCFGQLSQLAVTSKLLTLMEVVHLRCSPCRHIAAWRAPGAFKHLAARLSLQTISHTVKGIQLPFSDDDWIIRGHVPLMWCAAQYGKHIVPIGEDRALLSYLPGDKALEVIGVVEASRIPIHTLLEVRTREGMRGPPKHVSSVEHGSPKDVKSGHTKSGHTSFCGQCRSCCHTVAAALSSH